MPATERIKPRSTSPLADLGAAAIPKAAPPRKGGKFVKRNPLTPEAQAAHQEAEAAAEEEDARDQPVEPKNSARKTRKPFGRNEAKLGYAAREGFSRRWFNDDTNRIERALEAGYVLVLNDKRQPVTFSSGTNKAGNKRTLHLMEIPQEFYDEDFAAKQGALDEVDRSIYTGNHNKEPGDGRYLPKDIPIRMSVRRGTGSG